MGTAYRGARLIAFEGLDKSGKHSAMDAVKDFLERRGKKVAVMSFPRYETPVGKKIRAWLRGETAMTNEEFELLQALDKNLAQDEFFKLVDKEYDYILLDRYKHSQLAYGSVNNEVSWLKMLTANMVEPDVIFYLNVDPEVSLRRKGEHGRNDRYENDLELLKKVKNNYDHLFIGDFRVREIDSNQKLEKVIEDVLSYSYSL